MTMGPVQLLVLGFEGAELKGEVAAELDRLREADTIRLLDVAAVIKDADGQVRVVESAGGDAGQLARRLIDGESADPSDLDAAEAADLMDVAEAIPPGSAAAIALIEHRWAIPLREAIQRAGGTAITDAWVAPEDLAALGLTT